MASAALLKDFTMTALLVRLFNDCRQAVLHAAAWLITVHFFVFIQCIALCKRHCAAAIVNEDDEPRKLYLFVLQMQRKAKEMPCPANALAAQSYRQTAERLPI